jgi:hypothetical protein
MSVREQGVYVQFVMYPMVHGIKSQEEGREVCVDKPHVHIRVAGMDKDAFFGPVTDQIKARFPEEWEWFQKGVDAPKEGTPIKHWPKLTHQPSLVRLLENLSIFTIEDLAGCSDAALQKIGMGANALRIDAQKFLALSKTSADAAKMEALEKQNADQGEQLAALQAQMTELLAAQKPKARKTTQEAEA